MHASPRPLPRWLYGRTHAVIALVALLGAVAGCGDCGSPDPAPPPGPNNDNNPNNPPGADQGRDMSGVEDMKEPTIEDMLADMTDPGGQDMRGDMPPGDDMPGQGADAGADMPAQQEDMDPGTSTCPQDLRDSCAFEMLSCFGGSTNIEACVTDPVLNRDEVEFKNGARAFYAVQEINGEMRREFRTIAPSSDERCYRALAETGGQDPQAWAVLEEESGFVYRVTLTEDEARIICPGNRTEICSRTKFDLFFSWPDEFPSNCELKDPGADQCSFDSDCGADQLCCQIGPNDPRQCLDQNFCLTQREPTACEVDTDCGPSEECRRCTRSGGGGRECVPSGFSDTPNNPLGCEPDACSPGDGTCQSPRTCCLLGNTFTCSAPSECDSIDPNPTCSPSSAQPCASPVQDCCFVSQLNEFRCIDENVPCRTNVCFGDSDCGSNQQCCGANQQAGTAGTCLSQCQFVPISCSEDIDCVNANYGSLCCKYAGYTVGTCVFDNADCRLDLLECPNGNSDCTSLGLTCCDAAPLTTPTCITGAQMCPPDP